MAANLDLRQTVITPTVHVVVRP